MEIDKDNAEELDRNLEEMVTLTERISDIFDPQWKARFDILKTIITLCSGSIVLTVGFSNSFRSLAVGPFWKQLVILSFGLVVLALLLAFLALRFSAHVYELSANAFELKTTVPKVHKESASPVEFIEAFIKICQKAFDPIQKSDLWATRLYKASYTCFFVAMLLLGIVGFRQLSL